MIDSIKSDSPLTENQGTNMIGLAHRMDFLMKTTETSCAEDGKAQGPTY